MHKAKMIIEKDGRHVQPTKFMLDAFEVESVTKVVQTIAVGNLTEVTFTVLIKGVLEAEIVER